jgi:hypothetical protein
MAGGFFFCHRYELLSSIIIDIHFFKITIRRIKCFGVSMLIFLFYCYENCATRAFFSFIPMQLCFAIFKSSKAMKAARGSVTLMICVAQGVTDEFKLLPPFYINTQSVAISFYFSSSYYC